MVRWMRTLRIKDGKLFEAIRFFKEFMAIANSKLEGFASSKLWMEIYGDGNVLCMTKDFDSVADMDKAAKAAFKDPAYQEFVRAGSEFFLPDTVDKIYTIIE